MKIIALLTLLVLGSALSIFAQDTSVIQKPYRTWFSLNNQPTKAKGVLFEIQDSTISVAKIDMIKHYPVEEIEAANYNVSNIEIIKVRKNNNIGKGILIGTITGIAAGSIIGLISGDDPPDTFLALTAGEKALILGTPLAFGGAAIGGFVGAIKISIPINGSPDLFNQNKKDLINYSLMKE